jgi:hypothetical protein
MTFQRRYQQLYDSILKMINKHQYIFYSKH